MRYHKTTTTTTQRKPRSLSRTQTGFSLLELLISMAITVIAVIAAVGLMTKFARTVGAFTEVSTMEEARGTSETLLRADLDGAGHNLTRPSPPLAGTIFATLTSFDFYTWSTGTITKTGATGWDNPANITRSRAASVPLALRLQRPEEARTSTDPTATASPSSSDSATRRSVYGWAFTSTAWKSPPPVVLHQTRPSPRISPAIPIPSR